MNTALNISIKPKRTIKHAADRNRSFDSPYYVCVRLSDDFWQVGQFYYVEINDGRGNPDHKAAIVEKYTLLISEVPAAISYLAMGMTADQMIYFFKKRYPNVDFDTKPVDVLVFKNLERP